MTLLSKDMLKGISFESLRFIEPYSEIVTASNQHTGKPALLKGVTNRPGVLVVKYIDCIGVTRYHFKSIEICLGSAARRIYSLMQNKEVRNIQFAVIPTVKKYHDSIIKYLKKTYRSLPIDNHFEILKPWLTEQRTDKPPIEKLNFRRPFTEFGKYCRFSFYDYKNLSGLYLFRERKVLEGTIEDVYVGETTGVMSSRIRNKLYPNSHLYYKEIPGVKEYFIAPIEIKRSMLPQGIKFDKTLEKYQNVLINLLQTRDNKLGKIQNTKEFEETIKNGYKPIDIAITF